MIKLLTLAGLAAVVLTGCTNDPYKWSAMLVTIEQAKKVGALGGDRRPSGRETPQMCRPERPDTGTGSAE